MTSYRPWRRAPVPVVRAAAAPAVAAVRVVVAATSRSAAVTWAEIQRLTAAAPARVATSATTTRAVAVVSRPTKAKRAAAAAADGHNSRRISDYERRTSRAGRDGRSWFSRPTASLSSEILYRDVILNA